MPSATHRRVFLGAGFSPYKLQNIAARFDASNLASLTYDGGFAVSQWSDLSNNARHLVQGTGAKQPVLTIGAQNYLTFDGSNDDLKTAGFTLAQPLTHYLVARQVSFTDGDTIFDGNAGNDMRFFQKTASPLTRLFAGSAEAASNTDWATGADVVATVVFNGASSANRINKLTAATGSPGTAAPGGLTLGSYGDGTAAFANVRVYEWIVFSAAHPTLTQDRVISYLGRKWGIAV